MTLVSNGFTDIDQLNKLNTFELEAWAKICEQAGANNKAQLKKMLGKLDGP